MGRRFIKASNVEDLRRRIFKKMSSKYYPSGKFEGHTIRLDNIAKVMRKVKLTDLNGHERDLLHWEAFLAVETKLKEKTQKVFVDVTFESDDDKSLESPPPSNEGMLASVKPPLKDVTGNVLLFNLLPIQAIMRLVIEQDNVVLENVKPLEGLADWAILRKADLGEGVEIRV